MSYIYTITNTENGKFYVGKSIKLFRRWWEHLYMANTKNNRHPLYDSIRKYGIDKFKFDVIEECTDDILNEREIYWIAKLTPPYNLTIGGTGGDTFSKRTNASKEITRKKLSEHANRLWNNKSYRELITEKAIKNAQNPEYIKRVSVGVKKAIENKKDIWSECKRGKKNGRWLGYIEMYTPDGRLYKRYETAVDCYHDTGLSKHLIRRKAETGACMERGYFKNYTFKLVK
jgi:group I intron endonuclease